jgi:hypothetical protein
VTGPHICCPSIGWTQGIFPLAVHRLAGRRVYSP